MEVIVLQALGAIVFLAGSARLGYVTRRSGDKRLAEGSSRISHLLFWTTLVLPGAIGLLYPGLTSYDRLLGVPSLPASPVWAVTGAVLLCAGAGFMAAANRFLMKKGRGAAAFLLTEYLVVDGVYERTRNPMSLGYYAACLGLGLIAGSLTVTLAVVLIVVPVHSFNLKYFEERELALRYGSSYIHYKLRVPFLIPRIGRKIAVEPSHDDVE